MAENEKAVTTTATENATSSVITVVSTRGEKIKLPFAGGEWSQLKAILEKGGKCLDDDGNLTKTFSGYDLGNMKCVESLNRSTLEHPQCKVPGGNFNLFLMPVKSKSGGDMSRSEVNAEIKSLIEKDGDAARNHFNADKNYTNKPTTTLIDLLESYKPGSKKKVAAQKGEAISQVVQSVKSAKKQNNREEILAQLSGLSVDEKLDLVIQLLLEVKADGSEGTAEAAVPIAAAVKEESSAEKEAREKEEARVAEEKRIAEEKKRKKKEEDDKLEAEMREMSRGFGDVRM